MYFWNSRSTLWIVAALALCGCTINTYQAPNPVSSPTPLPVVPASSPAVNSNPAHGQKIGDPSLPTSTIPVTWSNLQLTGTMVYMSSVQTQNSLIQSIQALDLSNGNITTIFQTQNGAWIDFVSVSPDGKKLIMAYLPPHDNNSGGSGQQGLYTMPLDASQPPQLLFTPPSKGDQYYQPVWSPDGKYIYYAHVDYNAPPKLPGQHFAYYEIYRMAYPGGQPEKIADQAYWPRLSGDGARLAFVTLSPVDGTNQLFVANPDGSGAYEIMLTGLYVPPIIDAPFFTPDDRSILYSAVSPTQSYQPNWIDKLFGIIVAYAHTVPSDWWSAPIGGGTPTQLTHIAAVGLYASLSPDKRFIASYSGNGVFVMKMDGSGSTTIIGDIGGLSGTVSWIP